MLLCYIVATQLLFYRIIVDCVCEINHQKAIIYNFLFTCQVYEDVAAVVRQKPFRAWSAWWEPSSQNTQEVFNGHLKHSVTENLSALNQFCSCDRTRLNILLP